MAETIQDLSGIREEHVIAMARINVVKNEPSNYKSELNFLNSPYGIRSTLICIANIIREKAIAVAPINAPPSVTSKV